MSVTPEIPEKPFFRVNEVCQLTDTQPYVLRFWESEFPQLSPDHGRTGSPVYKKHDVELIFRIKRLLYEEDYTIAGARQVLSGKSSAKAKAKPKAPPKTERKLAAVKPSEPRQLEFGTRRTTSAVSAPAAMSTGTVPKERYDDAVEEITHLRLYLAEAKTNLRRAESEREKAMAEAEQLRDKRDRAIGRLEAILKQVQGEAS